MSKALSSVSYSDLTASFLQVKTPEDLALWFGFSKYAALGFLIFPRPKYTAFLIKKKNGSERLIQVPNKKLKEIQKRLLHVLNELDNSRPSAHGFRKKLSVVSNAEQHSGHKKHYVFNLDLKDFFPSITFPRVRGVFLSEPFKFPANVATVLARICTCNGALPQGAPTSPPLSNYICRGLDGSLQQIAKASYSTYTRYADDLTFSFTNKKRHRLSPNLINTAVENATVSLKLKEIIEDHGFKINFEKVRLRSRHARMEVTGLTVNEFPNVKRKFVDEIRGMLHAWETYGLEKAQEGFLSRLYKRQLRSGGVPAFENVLRGKLLYLRQVKGADDKVYNTLARRFNACSNLIGKNFQMAVPMIDVALSEQDLEKAIYVISCVHEEYDFEIKGTCFFLKGVGVVSCEHVMRYPLNVDEKGNKIHNFPRELTESYFGLSHGRIFIQDTIENPLCELEIVWLDRNADVVVLRPKDEIKIEHLTLIGATAETKTKEVRLVGFPFHTLGKSLSVAEGKIRSRYRHFGYENYDITSLIRQGNSGGPVLNSDFHVVGVAKEGERQDGGNNGVLMLAELIKLHAHYKNVQGPLPKNKVWSS